MTNNPTPQQIDQDLAEKVMGWKSRPVYGPDGHVVAVSWGQKCSRGFADTVKWSPSTSSDDCAEVLARLTDEQWGPVSDELIRTINTVNGPLLCSYVRAYMMLTPAQISEAVWRARCQSQ